jgi:hypothetical protein
VDSEIVKEGDEALHDIEIDIEIEPARSHS